VGIRDFHVTGVQTCALPICCTSGTAALNLGPAVAEAYYQQLPLLVITADRPQAWIGQMDGQTIPQAGMYGPLVRRSVQLPEVKDDRKMGVEGKRRGRRGSRA